MSQPVNLLMSFYLIR